MVLFLIPSYNTEVVYYAHLLTLYKAYANVKDMVMPAEQVLRLVEPGSEPEAEQYIEITPRAYVDMVRELYRSGEGEYRGQRTDEQKLIAETLKDEADEFLESVVLGTISVLSSIDNGHPSIDVKYLSPNATTFGKRTWEEYEGAFRQVVVGFGVLTNRLSRDGKMHFPELTELAPDDTKAVMNTLFRDFQQLNALRFGVDGSGVGGRGWRRNPAKGGKVERMQIDDIDKATSDHEIAEQMSTKGYRSTKSLRENSSMHIAGKMSPEEYIALRREHPEISKDEFDETTSYVINAKAVLEERE